MPKDTKTPDLFGHTHGNQAVRDKLNKELRGDAYLRGAQTRIERYGTDPEKLARSEGPDTSVAAAETLDTTRLERMVHRAIHRLTHSDRDGCIQDDLIAEFPSLRYSSVTARPSALRRKGFITAGPDKRKGVSGRLQNVLRSTREPE